MIAVYLGEAVSRRPEIYVNRVRSKTEGRFQSVENAESFLKGRSSRALVEKEKERMAVWEIYVDARRKGVEVGISGFDDSGGVYYWWSFDAYGAKQKSEPNTMLESTNYNTVPTAAYTEDVSIQMAKTL